jgi:hypothetical protein
MSTPEEKRFKAFMNKKPSNAQIMARIKRITAGKTPQSAKKFEVMKWGLQNSPNNTHFKMSEAMFNIQSESNTGFWNMRENEMVRKFNIPQNLVNRKLSQFTPRKRTAEKAAPKKSASNNIYSKLTNQSKNIISKLTNEQLNAIKRISNIQQIFNKGFVSNNNSNSNSKKAARAPKKAARRRLPRRRLP